MSGQLNVFDCYLVTGSIGGSKLGVYWANIPYFGGITSRCVTFSDQYPLPHVGSFGCLNWVGGGSKGGELGQGGKGEGQNLGGQPAY